MKRKIFALVVIFSISLGVLQAQESKEDKNDTTNRYFEINKNIDIFNSVLRELDMFYVDTLDINKAVRNGVDYMLNSLDPYTEYFDENDMTDFKAATTGEYAGIGAGIIYKDSMVVITDPFEGMPAAQAGLKAGDYILSIDGRDMTKCEAKEGEPYGQTLSSHVSSNLKGQPETQILVKVKRPGVKKNLEFKITRRIIEIDILQYYGVLENNTGYISLSSFTSNSGKKVKEAFNTLKAQGITSLILDLRDNRGGIMDDAIEIVNLFVPKGKEVVSTRGKVKQWDRTYSTTQDAIDAKIPLVVLINGSSASASEIVAGSLQDMDRAVLMGERTFGKGLVQTTREIPYGGSVKVTTSKYYIPSGRLVQELDYSHRKADGSVEKVADSLTNVFYTSIGREVRDGGGITPDIEVKTEKTPNIIFYLNNQFVIFDWVTDWTLKNKKIDSPDKFTISEEDYNNFKEVVKTKDFKYDRISEKTMSSLKEVMEFEGYMKTAKDEFEALEAKLVPDLERDLDAFKDEIIKHINSEIIKRYYYQKGVTTFSLKFDKTVDKAVEMLEDNELYKKTLSVQAKETENN